jgi:hypothetical protein
MSTKQKVEVNPDCIIEVTTTKHGKEIGEQRWATLCWQYIVPFGGMQLVKKMLTELVKTGQYQITDSSGTATFKIKQGHSLVPFNSGMNQNP